MSCRKGMVKFCLLGKKALFRRILLSVVSFSLCCFVSSSALANQNTASSPSGQFCTHQKNRRFVLPWVCQGSPQIPIINKPIRTNFVKDEILLVYDFGTTRTAVEDVTKKYKLKRKGGMALGALRKSVVIADTQGQSPLDLLDAINKAETKFQASTNNYYTLADSNNSSALGYSLTQTGVDRARAVAKGRGVVIGLVDTPVDASHPSLRGSNIEQHIVVDPRTIESKVHGTSIAGVLVSKAPQIGIAPEAKLLSVSAFSSVPGKPKVLRGKSTDIVRAIAYCIRRNVDIINLSFTGSRDKLVEQIIRAAIRKNITVVAAGGNRGRIGSTVYPAVIEGVIGVTAVDRAQRRFKYADQGRFIDIAAPGVSVLTTAPNGKYQVSTGTSIAAAHISGVMALLKSYRKDYSPNQLNSTAHDLGRRGRDDAFGYGLVDAGAALRKIGAPLP
ncbi:MAG: peptidase S8 and S53 subtilisin kexin sedolisin [Proteobacteria bacterium]|nr:MAG: peptidase S8 and S53 subtilisin kexin sedolisin [Pseudomonadota bacterium]